MDKSRAALSEEKTRRRRRKEEDEDAAVTRVIGERHLRLRGDHDALDLEEKSARDRVLFPDTTAPRPSSASWVPRGSYDLTALDALISTSATTPVSNKDDQRLESSSLSSWHEIPERTLTAEQERDLRVIDNRQHLDPKRFYKSSGTGRRAGELPTRVHFGTVEVGAHEFYSARIPRRQRRARVIDEILADGGVSSYVRARSRRLQMSAMISKRVVDPAASSSRRKRRAASEGQAM